MKVIQYPINMVVPERYKVVAGHLVVGYVADAETGSHGEMTECFRNFEQLNWGVLGSISSGIVLTTELFWGMKIPTGTIENRIFTVNSKTLGAVIGELKTTISESVQLPDVLGGKLVHSVVLETVTKIN